MENKSPQNQRVKYTGRFATEADSKPPRAAAPVRPRPTGTQAQAGRRPSGFAPAEPAKRRPAPRPAPAKANVKREKPVRNKRTPGRKSGWGWKLPLLAALALVIVLTVILFAIFGGRNVTHHQLPKVERGSSSAFTPEETNAPEGTEVPQMSAATEAPAEADVSASDGEAAIGEADFFNDLERLDESSFFDDAEDLDGTDLLNELLALEGANQ